MPGLPHHGIGRSCKAGKAEIIGLLVALERLAATKDDVRCSTWIARLEAIVAASGNTPGLTIHDRALPVLELACEDPDGMPAC